MAAKISRTQTRSCLTGSGPPQRKDVSYPHLLLLLGMLTASRVQRSRYKTKYVSIDIGVSYSQRPNMEKLKRPGMLREKLKQTRIFFVTSKFHLHDGVAKRKVVIHETVFLPRENRPPSLVTPITIPRYT